MKKKILLILPNEENRKHYLEILENVYDVTAYSDREDGYRMLREFSDIAAVLIDLKVCIEDNFYIESIIKQKGMSMPVSVIGVAADVPEIEDTICLDHGFMDVLSRRSPAKLVLRRIQNSIDAEDSVTFHEIEHMLRALPCSIFLKDTEGRYVFNTQRWHHFFHTEDPNWTIRGKTDLDIRKDKENALRAMASDRQILETGQGMDYIIEEKEDGVDEFIELIKRPVFDDKGQITGIIALVNDVTERQRLKTELEKRSRVDALTELLNKGTAEERIRMTLEDDQTGRNALLMIDVDNFKHINDQFGHATGDDVLTEVGRIIRKSSRNTDVAGRVGGDEFVLLLKGIPYSDIAVRTADRIQNQVRYSFAGSMLEKHVSLSIGIAVFPDHADDFESLYRAADEALYYVKNHGKSGYCMYPPDAN